MKNLPILLTAFLLAFSCTNNEPLEESFILDPNIIKEYHVLNRNGDIRLKYLFNEQGRFTTYITSEFSVEFKYDQNNRVTEFIKTNLQNNSNEIFNIVYDSEGRIASFAERIFTYNADDNYYTDNLNISNFDFIDESDPNILYTESYYRKYFADENGIITNYCRYEVYSLTYLDTNETEIQADGCSGYNLYSIYYTTNVDGYLDSNEFGYQYEYDENPNPLYNSDSNLLDLRILFEDQFNSNPYGFGQGGIEKLFCIISQNNLVDQGENCSSYGDACGPEGVKYTYELNELELPIQVIAQNYYVGEPEGSDYIYAKYYYQGDQIPE